MKFLRNKGQSYTEYSELRRGSIPPLGRGVEVRPGQLLTPPSYAGEASIAPDRLADYLSTDYLTILRRAISCLDKTVRKVNSLRAFHIDAYADRTLLAGEIWTRLCSRLEKDIRALPNGDAAFAKFEETWNWKVHPYARHAVNVRYPRDDENASVIRNATHSNAEPRPERAQFEGRWHAAFWRTGKDGRPDYPAIADGIIKHLFEQEWEIRGDARQSKGRAGPPTGAPALRAHGHAIARSANDPRAERPKDKQKNWDEKETARYFQSDIAAAIRNDVLADPHCGTDARRRTYYTKRFGSLLYDHFKPVLDDVHHDKDAQYRMFSLHNAVREFYGALARSDRFWIAERAASPDADRNPGDRYEQIRIVLPRDKDALLRTLGAKERNASISELIRVGKLVVHAADMLDGRDPVNEDFARRMDHLVTSAGQSEIKRNEAFTRVWRNSVALSLRTLKAWIDPAENAAVAEGRNKSFLNEDLAGANVAMRAVKQLNRDQYRRHASLVFGDLQVDGKSRAAIFQSEDRAGEQDCAWAFLRLAAEIRNRTNHFSTRARVVKLVTEGVLKETAAKDRHPERASHTALAAFASLLQFDVELQRHAVARELNRLGVGRYATGSDLPGLFNEIAAFAAGGEVPPPKFLSVLRRVAALAENDSAGLHEKLAAFRSLDVKNLSKSKPSADEERTEEVERRNLNHCRIGLLRLLYAGGFQHWLQAHGATHVQACAQRVTESKRERARAFQKDHDRYYTSAQTLLDDLSLESIGDLTDLFRRMTAHASDDRSAKRSYKPSREAQEAVASWVEEFRQEVYAHLFAEYLADAGLGWIWDIRSRPDDGSAPAPIEPRDIKLGDGLGASEAWHSQFYAWLYLVPVDDIALLRHQFLKTAALERKGAGATDERLVAVLGQMTWLMGLYTRVQSAGFSGAEHGEGGLLQGILFEDPAQYDQVFNPDMEEQLAPYPGTRRGLRQMLRFGHYTILKSILEKNPVTRGEVEEFVAQKSGKVRDLLERKNALHRQAVVLMKAAPPDMAALTKVSADYRAAASAVALHNFAVNGARLTEHAKFHQLMMRIVGRLADFTGMWERDRAYLLLGMIWRKNAADLRVEARRLADDWPHQTVVLVLSNPLAEGLRKGLAPLGADKAPKHVIRHHAAMIEGVVPIWDDHRGFQLDGFRALAGLLDDGDRALFERYFVVAPQEHAKDVEARLRIEKSGKGKPRTSEFRTGRQQIRNDFAHYNVISTRLARNLRGRPVAESEEGQPVDRRTRMNMSYLVNAVRSLLSYDRKLKNAVSKAIADILLDEGLIIRWRMHQDRLVGAEIMPKLESHLTMGRTKEARELAFRLPQASVRFTSMAKALFDFESGGYRLPVGPEEKRRGELGYPPEFKAQFGREIPPEALEYRLPALRPGI